MQDSSKTLIIFLMKQIKVAISNSKCHRKEHWPKYIITTYQVIKLFPEGTIAKTYLLRYSYIYADISRYFWLQMMGAIYWGSVLCQTSCHVTCSKCNKYLYAALISNIFHLTLEIYKAQNTFKKDVSKKDNLMNWQRPLWRKNVHRKRKFTCIVKFFLIFLSIFVDLG